IEGGRLVIVGPSGRRAESDEAKPDRRCCEPCAPSCSLHPGIVALLRHHPTAPLVRPLSPRPPFPRNRGKGGGELRLASLPFPPKSGERGRGIGGKLQGQRRSDAVVLGAALRGTR